MEKITTSRLLELLTQYGTAVHCETYIDYYKQYFDEDKTGIYYDRG